MKDFLDISGAAALRVLSAFLSSLSNEAAAGFGRFLGACIFPFHSRRRVAYADLKAAFGARFTEPQRWQIVRSHYQHMVQSAIEILRLPVLSRMPAKELFEVHTSKQFFEELKENQGAIYLTGHFGNWEMLQLFAQSEGRSVFVLAREQKFSRMNEIVNQIREAAGFRVIRTGMGVRGLFRSLRRKELVGLLGDQDAGKTGGLILPFLGRKTTVPTGAFELAARAGARLYPIFMARRGEQTFYDIYVNPSESFQRPGGGEISILKRDFSPRHEGGARNAMKVEEEIAASAQRYLALLEKFISQYPEQWLWEVKRWKYSWTKRILILSDGKPGHVKQSEGVAAQFQRIDTQYGRPGMEYPTSVLQAEYLSRAHRILFPWFAVLFRPWAQGNLRFLKFFFKKETVEALVRTSADFIISAGSGLAPLNLCLAKDCRAKSIVVMKPAFPFNLFRYDLALVPAHDQGMVPEGTLRTLITPARMEAGEMESSAEKISAAMPQPEKVRMAVFLGGSTRRFRIHLKDIQTLFEILNRVSPLMGDYALTTSRRTPDEISAYLKKEYSGVISSLRKPAEIVGLQPRNDKEALKNCQLVVIAREDRRPEVAPGMMALADILIVTEDSVSMISEALRSGKKVVVLSLDSEGLPGKHRRFKEILERESAVTAANLENLEEKLLKLSRHPNPDLANRQDQMLKKRLQEIL